MSFRDVNDRIAAANAVVLGVSRDGVASHDRFVAKYDLPFALLADTDHAVADSYGAWGEKKMYGNLVKGMKRMTFLIDEEGRIEKIWPKVSPHDHGAEVLAALTA